MHRRQVCNFTVFNGKNRMIVLYIYLILFVSWAIQEPKPSIFISKNVNHTNYSSQRFVTSKLDKNSEPTNVTKTHNTDLTSNNAEVNLSNKINPLNRTSNSELSSSIIDINNLHTHDHHDDDDTYDYEYDDSDDNTLKTDHDNNHIFLNTSCNSTNNTLVKDNEIDDNDDNEFPEAGVMLDVPLLDVHKIRHHGDERYEEKTAINSFGDTAAQSHDNLAIKYNFYDHQYPHFITASDSNQNCELAPRLIFMSIVCYSSITYKYNYFLL